MDDKINKIENLVYILNEATNEYEEGHSLFSDKEWDDMYFELLELEKETGYISIDSPTHRIHFKTVSELKKVEHNHPMLSLDKTKDINVIKSFIGNHDWIAMAKMDGLTCSLHYLNGKLVSAETRGNGIIGEDITHNAKVISSIPKTIYSQDEIIIDGEIICTYKDFENFKEIYKNPRNFASGSIRLLDSEECHRRHLTFVAWDVVKGGPHKYLSQNLMWTTTQGFYITPCFFIEQETPLDEVVEIIKQYAKFASFPIDGVVFKYDNIEEYNKAGRTDHHFKGGLAYKFYDETYDTKLRNIEWTMGRMGVLTPVAIYNDVNIEGTICNRASLHNLSIMNNLFHNTTPYVGQNIKVFKSNLIIPQIYSTEEYEIKDGVEYQFLPPPIICPYCGELTKVKQDNESKILYCNNPNCEGKLINRLDHFCSKKGLDIKGLSKATLEKLINWEWVTSISDLFKLHMHQSEWMKKSGFGQASVNKIINAIEEAKNCTFDKYLCALGIPLIGKVASKALMYTFNDYKTFRKAIEEKEEKLYHINGIGEIMINNLLNYDYTEADIIFDKYITEDIAVASSSNDTVLDGKVFVITGKLGSFKNRDELKSFIESKGGKVAGSVTSKTSYLINNDTGSTTAKNLTAIKLNVPIINEDEFLTLVTPPNESVEPSYLVSAT